LRNTSSSVVRPSATFITPDKRRGAQPLLGHDAAQPGHVDRRVQRTADGLGHWQQLVQADSSLVAGHAAVQAADGLVGLPFSAHAPRFDGIGQRVELQRIVGLLAMRAQRARQPLSQHADQGRADQVWRHTQVSAG